MTLSTQKFLLILLLKSLFISCVATHLRLSTISHNLKENDSPKIENVKDKISLLEVKSETKTTPVK